MAKYTRITIDSLQRGDRTEWRVTGWVSGEERVIVAYCPTKDMAETLKRSLLNLPIQSESAASNPASRTGRS
jgi:hypothetical protein